MTTQQIELKLSKSPAHCMVAALGLIGLLTGCSTALAQNNQAKSPAQMPSALPTLLPTPTPLPVQSTPVFLPTATPWPMATLWPTPTPWPAPKVWQPKLAPLPTLAPLPVVALNLAQADGLRPVSYSPPDGVDVFGSTVLRWSYGGTLAEDEFFDIKIKPVGSNDSVFVDWSKTPEYPLQPWSGWQPGLYTWQIGIVKGSLEGQTKHFVANTGRDSQLFLIKWQAGGGDGSSVGGPSGTGGGRSGGS